MTTHGPGMVSSAPCRPQKHNHRPVRLRIACILNIHVTSRRRESFRYGNTSRAIHSHMAHRSRPCVASRRLCLTLKSVRPTSAALFVDTDDGLSND
jgi:hypothetical protein